MHMPRASLDLAWGGVTTRRGAEPPALFLVFLAPIRSPLPPASSLTQTRGMPIAPEHRWFYPIDWRELSLLVRFGRAGGCCEHCGRPHGQDVVHLGDGTWWDEARRRWRDGRGRRVRGLPELDALEAAQPGLAGIDPRPMLPVTRVVLASAHLDHDPGHNRLRNLAALCQRCQGSLQESDLGVR